jgi:TorA maturation chaperone TorD
VELLRALGALAEDCGPAQQRIAAGLGLGELDAAEYTELFSFALYPYASVYLGAEGMLGGEARDRVAGFWRALGLVPPEEPDHLATMLALYAQLVERAAAEEDELRRAAIERARAAFFWEHLASWLPVYLSKARTLARGAYLHWADLLARALENEAHALEDEAQALAQPGTLPLHLREAPPFEDDESEREDAFVASLLAPVRTGFILIRADLRRISGSMGIALRQGERRYALGALLAQDRTAVMFELARTAREAAGAHAALPAVWGEIALFWKERARESAEYLEALANVKS